MILSLICQIFVEHTALGPGFAWLVRAWLTQIPPIQNACKSPGRNRYTVWRIAGRAPAWIAGALFRVIPTTRIRCSPIESFLKKWLQGWACSSAGVFQGLAGSSKLHSFTLATRQSNSVRAMPQALQCDSLVFYLDGHLSYVRPSSSRPARALRTLPHSLKKNGTQESRHCFRIETTQSRLFQRRKSEASLESGIAAPRHRAVA